MEIVYRKELFESGFNTIIASEVQIGMIICLSRNRYFYVDDIGLFFKNGKVAKLYGDSDEVALEHYTITFYSEDFDSISNIPPTTYVIAFKRIDGDKQSNINNN